jgi:sortase A
VFREEDPLLLKVGMIMMALALAFTVVGVVVTLSLRSEPEQAVASETTTKSSSKTSVEPLIRGQSPYEPWVEKATPPPTSGVSMNESDSEPSASEPKPEYKPLPQPTPKLQSEPPPQPEPQAQAEPKAQPEPEPVQEETLLGAEDDWQAPTQQELGVANRPRHYGLPAEAIMSLTIKAIGIYNAPVFDSDSQWALANGVAHVPETTLPWSPTAQRNVFLAGHRMGYRGTWSRLIFYNLNKLKSGDEVVLKDHRAGKVYSYRVSEIFLAEPYDSWVMGQVRGRDMVTLQTCTPIPTFNKRLIVRADRV